MPNSLLWAGLVALWLFVLFPILADKHPRIRRTTDAALATRVLIRGGSKRRRKGGPSTGHSVDPDWSPSPEDLEGSLIGESKEVPMSSEEEQEVRASEAAGHVPDDIDDVRVQEVHAREAEAPAERRTSDERTHSAVATAERRYRPGRGGFDPEADRIAREAKFAFRQRMILALLVAMVALIGVSIFVTDQAWWGVGAVVGMLVGYLVYLRRQVSLETEIRRRRSERFNRGRLDPNKDAGAGRAGVRRAPVVLELDDEDPAFEHLATVRSAMDLMQERPMRRAAGE